MPRFPPPPPYHEEIALAYEQRALGEWLMQQQEQGRKEVPHTEIDLVRAGINLGVAHALNRRNV